MRYHPLCCQQSAAAHVDRTHKEVGVRRNTALKDNYSQTVALSTPVWFSLWLFVIKAFICCNNTVHITVVCVAK